MGAKLRLEGITKHFGGAVAVSDLDLEVEAGEFVSLLGPSGCGKTTTLNLLAGFLTPDKGEIHADGALLSSPRHTVPPERRGFSMIFQTYALWPHKTVFENVGYGLRLRNVGRSEIQQRVHEVLASVQMDEYAKRYPSELSGGQQQRIALARALAVRPAVLLMDEPLSNLDASLREAMRVEIRRLHEQFGMTSVYVTHDQTEAMVMSDRVVVMEAGHKVQDGPPEEVYDRPATEFVAGFVGRMNRLEGVVLSGAAAVGHSVLPIPTKAGGDTPADGSPVRLGFRPHDGRLTPLQRGEPPTPSGPEARIDGVVVRTIYMGHSREFIVAVEQAGGAQALLTIAAAVSEPGMAHGTKVTVTVPCERLHLLAVDGGATQPASKTTSDITS